MSLQLCHDPLLPHHVQRHFVAVTTPPEILTPAANTAHAVAHLAAPCAWAAMLVHRPAARAALAVPGDEARCWEVLVTGVTA